jgi:hypothetical protein
MAFKDSHDAACELWHYFYIAHAPSESERAEWRKIECATIRIRESVQYLTASFPAPMQVKHAKRVRRATREIIRRVEKLDRVPELWVAEALGQLEGIAQSVLDALEDQAGILLH